MPFDDSACDAAMSALPSAVWNDVPAVLFVAGAAKVLGEGEHSRDAADVLDAVKEMERRPPARGRASESGGEYPGTPAE